LSCVKSQPVFERRLWSLADMLTHFCFRTFEVYRTLDFAINLLTFSNMGIARMDEKSQRETAKMAAEEMLAEGRRIGWQLSDDIRTTHFISDLTGGARLSTDALVREMQGMKVSFHLALQKTKFAYMPAPDNCYFENDKLFGEKVFDFFDEARQDIKDAGNCLAASLYTACVFHLMRVAELGLRRVAKRLKVRLFDKGKPQLVEYATWDKVIERIHDKIGENRKLSASPKKQAILERFSDAGDHCTFMKDIWRNNASHTRKPYIRGEALAAFGRVNEFMSFLAQALGTPK
jgi:hypothetical protein